MVRTLKPITWFPPVWAFACGVVSVGGTAEWGRVVLGLLVAGPLVCAASQVVNDWFDREVDAINEPDRPIPSGALPGRWGLGLAIFWTLLSLVAGLGLGRVGFAATAAALVLAWAYSAPPLRLKRNGWYGNAAVGFSYEGLAWVTGAAVALGGMPPLLVLGMAGLYSLGAHGIMTLNDFKSVEGDRKMGIGSLPARLDPDRAAQVACATMLIPQLVVLFLLVSRAPLQAGLVLGLILCQLPMMRRFLQSPSERALWYSALGVPLFVLGMMVTATGIR